MAETRRFSKQRQIIYDYIVNNAVHPSADTIYQELKEENPNLSLGTVYRNLSVLSDDGQILKIDPKMTSERYDGRVDNHYHMLCDNCNRMFDVVTPYQENLLLEAQNCTEHELKEHNIIFYGTCKNCKKNI